MLYTKHCNFAKSKKIAQITLNCMLPGNTIYHLLILTVPLLFCCNLTMPDHEDPLTLSLLPSQVTDLCWV